MATMIPQPSDSQKKNADMAKEMDTYTIDEVEYLAVKENTTSILFPKTNEVFYNPVQQFNRDMSVAAIRTWYSLWNREGKELPRGKRRRLAGPGRSTDVGSGGEGEGEGGGGGKADHNDNRYEMVSYFLRQFFLPFTFPSCRHLPF